MAEMFNFSFLLALVTMSILCFCRSTERFIEYNKQSSTNCDPSSACKGIDIRSIPFIFNHVTENFVKTQDFYDTDAVSSCLKNKRIVLLGDSTMIELANDMTILLSGLALDSQSLEKYLYRTTHVDAKYSHYDLPNHVQEFYYGNHRNMTIYSSKTNTHIRSRYIGHYDPRKDDMGVKTLLEKRFQN
jgi:hypothetical protein